MSIQMYTSDNLSIIAGIGEQIESIYKETESPIITGKTLRLHIQILVNGKIKNIFQQYEIIKQEGTVEVCHKLREYHSFNTLCDILKDLGYDITGFYGKLEDTIEKLFN